MNFYRRTEKGIKCLLCRYYCNLADGQSGICGVNANGDDRLVNLVYGKAAALHIDPVEKKPLYHFLPGSKAFSVGTVGCNFRCPFCQNWQISQNRSLSFSQEASPEEIVEAALRNSCKSIAYTYNEPAVFYPYARDIAVLAHEKGLKNIFVSNGFESAEAIEDMKGIIDAFNVDLKSFDASYYKRVLKGDLGGVLDTLKLLREGGFLLELTTLVVPGVNDDEKQLANIAAFISGELGEHTPWHISAFFPNYKMKDTAPTSYMLLQRAFEAGRSKGLKYIYMGNIGGEVTTFCPSCGEKLIVRRGYDVEVNLLENRGLCPKCKTKIEGLWQ